MPPIDGVSFDLSTSAQSSNGPVLYVGGIPPSVVSEFEDVTSFAGCISDLAFNFRYQLENTILKKKNAMHAFLQRHELY